MNQDRYFLFFADLPKEAIVQELDTAFSITPRPTKDARCFEIFLNKTAEAAVIATTLNIQVGTCDIFRTQATAPVTTTIYPMTSNDLDAFYKANITPEKLFSSFEYNHH